MAKKKELTADEIRQQITELQEQLKLIENKKPDFENIKAGDRFEYCGLKWVCLDPDFEGGILSIVAKPWRDEVVFSEADDNNYRTSDIRKLLLEELAPSLEGKVINHFPDLTEENGKSFEDIHYEDPVFLLSLSEYIRYSKYIPYEEYKDADGEPQYWWLRTPRLRSADRGHSYGTWHVNTSGNVLNNSAIYDLACAPACIFIR